MKLAESRVGVVVSDGYQELEFWYPVLRFREEGAAVTVIGAEDERTYVSKLGYPVIPDTALAALAAGSFDLIVIPSGAADDAAKGGALTRFLETAAATGAVLGAIGGAAQVLRTAGLLRGSRDAAAPAAARNDHSDGAIVVDDFVITARAPDDLPEFFRAVAERLAKVTR